MVKIEGNLWASRWVCDECGEVSPTSGHSLTVAREATEHAKDHKERNDLEARLLRAGKVASDRYEAAAQRQAEERGVTDEEVQRAWEESVMPDFDPVLAEYRDGGAA
jgi:hypothetical protein